MLQRALALGAAAASLAASLASAHTWIDCFDTDRSKIYDQSASYIFGGSGGNGFCEGYGAGYPGRGDTNIGTEYTYKMLLNEVEAGVAVCQSVAADTYSDWRTRISVAPGTQIYYAYLPNGHIAKDKKGIGTQHGVYWTGVPGTSLSTTNDMTAANLINGFTLDYDDGNCGETYDYYGNPSGRAGDGKPCIGYFTIPEGTAAGIYNMVWYWTFYLPDGSYADATLAKGYFGASYSTCFQVEVTGASGSAATAAPAVTTAAPAVTTVAPAVTTAAPVVTTATPVAATAAPEVTTTAPAVTTAAPAVTTAAPADTTVAPATTTAAPTAVSSTDASSATTTDAPTATIATESRSLDFNSLGSSGASSVGTVHAVSDSSNSTDGSYAGATVGSDDTVETITTSAPSTSSPSSGSSSGGDINVEVKSNNAARLNGGTSWLTAASTAVIASVVFQVFV